MKRKTEKDVFGGYEILTQQTHFKFIISS